MTTNNAINQYSEQLAIAPDAVGTTSQSEPLTVREDYNGVVGAGVRNRENAGGSTAVNVRFELGARDTSGNLLGGTLQLGNDVTTVVGGSGTDSRERVLLVANNECDGGIGYRASSSLADHIWYIDSTGDQGVEQLRLTKNGFSFNSGTYEWKVEKGTFFPTIFGSSTAGTPTYSFQVGRYQKVGTMVQISGAVRWTALSGSAGSLRMGALPFTVSNATNYTGQLAMTPTSVGANGYQICMQGRNNATDCAINEHPNDGSTADANVAHNAWYGANPTIEFSGCYESKT